jgi:molybdopterin converting factor small subunit
MQVTLEYTAQLKRAAGIGREAFVLPDGATLSDALRHAAYQHGDEFRRLVFTSAGSIHPVLLLFHGDAQVSPAADQRLNDGDTVTVMTPISGG